MLMYVWTTALWQAVSETPAPSPSESGGSGGGSTTDLITQVIGPILGTGLVGAFLIMVLFRIKIMPTYVYDQAKVLWDDERTRLMTENAELKTGLKEANLVYTTQVIPTLTRVLDAERELVDLRRDEAAERRRRGPGPE